MSKLIKVSDCDDLRRKGDVVFVHGLDGDAISTWRPVKHHGASRCQPLFFVFDCPGRRLDFGVFRVIGR